MGYSLGIVGAGHWTRRLLRGIDEDTPIEISKVVDVKPYTEKKDLMDYIGVSEKNYFNINRGEPVPDEFFTNLDIVQIASPIEYHREQTLDVLNRDIPSITEKSFASDRDEFNDVLDYLDNRDKWSDVYLHLHYLKKQPTLAMPEVLERATSRLGEINRIESAFIEEYSEEDKQRGWLFNPDNGGVLLDWIHPIEVIVHGAGGKIDGFVDGDGYLIEESYTNQYPTAARAEYVVNGEYFSDDAEVVIRVGKGFPSSSTHKVMRFIMDNGYVDFEYASSEEEFNTDYRGRWKIVKGFEDTEVIEEVEPTGAIPYRYLIKDIYDLLEGSNRGLGRDEIVEMFNAVWMYNESVDITSPIRNKEQTNEFLETAINTTTGGA